MVRVLAVWVVVLTGVGSAAAVEESIGKWSGPAWVVLTDGSSLEVEAWRRQDGLVLVRCEGELYSLPWSRVAAVRAVTTPKSKPTTRRPARPARLRRTGGTLNVAAPVPVKTHGPPVIVDRRGSRDESYWRGRSRPLLRRVAEGEDRVQAATAALETAEYELRVALRGGTASVIVKAEKARQQAGRDVETARAALCRIEAELDELQNEARRAGAWPGWLR